MKKLIGIIVFILGFVVILFAHDMFIDKIEKNKELTLMCDNFQKSLEEKGQLGGSEVLECEIK